MNPRIDLADLSLPEKAALLSGGGAWHTAAVDRLGITPVILTDGPHGVRLENPDSKQFSFADSLPATCFPTAAALGSSWDSALLTAVGEALGDESRAAGVGVLLGPGVNIKRSPLCGRNFEYLSEDPYLSGRLGAALVHGIQSRGVGASVKHFAANNQETDRMRVSAEVDERTLREIYLPAFEHIVTEARPWTVMAAYNRLNGVHAAQNNWLLNQVLRDEWGFQGLVVSDWGAVIDPVAAVEAGLDLVMPGTGGSSAAALLGAVETGRLDESVIDRAATRVLKLIGQAGDKTGAFDQERHHALARRAAASSAVLLKNEDAILPLAPGARLAVIGEFARTPRYQGAGSSKIVPTRVENALDALGEVTFVPGLDGAAEAAAGADVAVVFLGLPEGNESEGYDRTDIDLPAEQLLLLEAVAAANPNVVVVLANGGVVRTSTWDRHAKAVLETWLSGQAGGAAIADLLYGRVNPSGRLAETIPLRLQDTPAYLDFPGSESQVRYGERIYVGYRHYDARELAVAYPFGHGLSYTTFAYSGLELTVDEDTIRVRATIQNTGARTGSEVVQIYVRDPEASVDRPVRELKAFHKIELAPGASATVETVLTARDLSFYSVARGGWVLEPGEFEIAVGASSRDLRLTGAVKVTAASAAGPLTLDSTLGEWLAHPVGGPLLTEVLDSAEGMSAARDPEIRRMVESLPLSRLVAMSGGRLDPARLTKLVELSTP